MMAGSAHRVMRLLLFLLICVKGDGDEPSVDGLTSPGRGNDIVVPCGEDFVCVYFWSSADIAIVTNGEMLKAGSMANDSRCLLQARNLTKVVGRHRCLQTPAGYSPLDAVPYFNLWPGKSMSMQCVDLGPEGQCGTQKQRVSLTWVDGVGKTVRADSRHLIKKKSSCDTTLTVTRLTSGSEKFRCKATVGSKVLQSAELAFRVSVRKPTIFRPKTIPKRKSGIDTDTRKKVRIGLGVAGAGLAALITFLVVRRRRSNRQPDESNNNVGQFSLKKIESKIFGALDQ